MAAGFAPAALGTDTNASILMPATRNDVYAMKPTIGLISPEGVCPITADFDSVGPIARSARDIAVLMDALVDREKASKIPQGTYTSQLTGSFEGIRIGVLEPKEWHMPSVAVHPNPAVDDQQVGSNGFGILGPLADPNENQDADISAAYKKLRSLGVVVKEVKLVSLDELIVDGMSQIQRVMSEPASPPHHTTTEQVINSLLRFPVQKDDRFIPLDAGRLQGSQSGRAHTVHAR